MQICAVVNPETFQYESQHNVDARWTQTDFEIRLGHESLRVVIMIKESYMSAHLDKAMLSLVVKALKSKSLAIASCP